MKIPPSPPPHTPPAMRLGLGRISGKMPCSSDCARDFPRYARMRSPPMNVSERVIWFAINQQRHCRNSTQFGGLFMRVCRAGCFGEATVFWGSRGLRRGVFLEIRARLQQVRARAPPTGAESWRRRIDILRIAAAWRYVRNLPGSPPGLVAASRPSHRVRQRGVWSGPANIVARRAVLIMWDPI